VDLTDDRKAIDRVKTAGIEAKKEL
jgi:hypothetical protein